MTSKHPEPTSVTLGEGEIVLTVDLDMLAAELSRQPTSLLINLIDRVDYHTADWALMDALEKWMKAKINSEDDTEL